MGRECMVKNMFRHEYCHVRRVCKWRKDLGIFGINALTSALAHVWFGWVTVSTRRHMEVSVMHAHAHEHTQGHTGLLHQSEPLYSH